MATVNSVLNDISTLSASEKVELRGRLIKMFTPQVGSLNSFVLSNLSPNLGAYARNIDNSSSQFAFINTI